MPKIFISYRREDSEAIAGRLYDRLEVHFGHDNVFIDIDNIPFGVDFRQHLDQAVSRCDVLLAVIGEQWLEVCHKDGANQGQRRLEDASDFVRIEIESALARGIPVIPVLVGKATMPANARLPQSLKELAFRNAAEVRPGRDFRDHVDRLARGIEELERQAINRRQIEAERQRAEQEQAEAQRNREREEAAKQQKERDAAERARREQENTQKKREEDEADRKQQELDRIAKEGESEFAHFVRQALYRTRGKPTPEDTAQANDIRKKRAISVERAKQILADVRSRWQQDRPSMTDRKAGDIITNSLGMKFSWIPPGTFLMGSPANEVGRSDGEIRHKVTLTKGFYLGVHLVTRGYFAQFVKETDFKTQAEQSGDRYVLTGKAWDLSSAEVWRTPKFTQTDDHPVVCVHWNDGSAFARWLAMKENAPYRLPTEAEWEYSCRAGTTTPFHFGATISAGNQANYDGTRRYGGAVKPVLSMLFGLNKALGTVFRRQTTPVGTFPANAFGLFDMHGNAWELCQDWLGDYPRIDAIDPKGPDSGEHRAMRGGAWGTGPHECRSAQRGFAKPDQLQGDQVGFRLCIAPN